MGLVTTARAAPFCTRPTARSIDCLTAGTAASLGRPAMTAPRPTTGSTGRACWKRPGAALASETSPIGTVRPNARARSARTAASPIKTKGGMVSRILAVQARSVMSGPIPAGSPRVSAKGRSSRPMALGLARKAPLAVFDEGLLTEIAQQALGAEAHFLVHQFALRLRAGIVVAPERALAADRIQLDGSRRNGGGRHLPYLRARHEQPRRLCQRRRLLVLERLHACAVHALGEFGAGPKSAAQILGCRKLCSDGPLIGARGDFELHLPELQGGLRRASAAAFLPGIGHGLGDIGVADLHVAAEFAPHRLLPNELRPDAVLERLDVDAGLAERGGEAIDAKIVLLRHVFEDLRYIVLVGGHAEFPALLQLQPFIDQHVGRLLLQSGRGLLLRGDGEEALALVDVIVGDWVVVDENLDRDLLRHSGSDAADQRDREQERSDQAAPATQGSAGNGPHRCDVLQALAVIRHGPSPP